MVRHKNDYLQQFPASLSSISFVFRLKLAVVPQQFQQYPLYEVYLSSDNRVADILSFPNIFSILQSRFVSFICNILK